VDGAQVELKRVIGRGASGVVWEADSMVRLREGPISLSRVGEFSVGHSQKLMIPPGLRLAGRREALEDGSTKLA
jgi:hypothetical protein